MPGFWYPTAIAAVTSAFLGLAGSLSIKSAPQLDHAGESEYDAVLVAASGGTGNSHGQITTQSAALALENQLEDRASQQLEQAQKLANQAVKAFQSARLEPKSSLAYTRRERDLWQAALQSLASIPQKSELHNQATSKQKQYQQLLATADRKVAKADSAFLAQIIEDTGVWPEQVHVTLCQIDNPSANIHSGPAKLLSPAHSSITDKTQVKSQINSQQCRHHQGDQLLASPASLIKLAIAIALLQEADAGSVDLNQKIEIDPGNFTENAEGAILEVGKAYSLRQIMTQMIDHSDNIATNQLIDYMGRDRLAAKLEEMGYVDTYAGHKLVGDLVMPEDAGDRGNQATTNDLAAMLVQTYSLQGPGEQALLQALHAQTDRELGYQALQDLDAQWLGEKTGQNGYVIGSALAMQVGQERYALAVAIDDSGDIQAVQKIVSGIASYLEDTAGLMVRHRALTTSSLDDIEP